MNYAMALASEAVPGSVICLTGDLGSGKTVFAKGFAKGLGVVGEITSPTFTIINEYPWSDSGQSLALYHFDVYRMAYEDPVEALLDMGAEEYFYGDGVCLIEWADLISQIIPQKSRWVDIRAGLDGENHRIISISEEIF